MKPLRINSDPEDLMMFEGLKESANTKEEPTMPTPTKLTPGRALARQRQNHLRKLKRLVANYDKESVDDTDIKVVLYGLIKFLEADTARYNARAGGLGRK